MRPFQVVAFVLFAVSLNVAQSAPVPAAKTAASQRFSIDNIDKTVDPCTDFYQYACGNWIKNTEIPADQSSWVSFNELDERNQYTMRDILDKAAVASPARDAITQKIGDFYSSCMDEKAADAKGSEPLKPELEHIAAVKDKTALIDAIAELHLRGTRGCSVSILRPTCTMPTWWLATSTRVDSRCPIATTTSRRTPRWRRCVSTSWTTLRNSSLSPADLRNRRQIQRKQC